MMQGVEIKKQELAEILQKNREGHRELFLKAQEGYRDAVLKTLQRMLDEARTGGAIRTEISLPVPVDRTEDYGRVIRMMELSVDDTVHLSEHEFSQFVMDKWDWSAHAYLTNTSYT